MSHNLDEQEKMFGSLVKKVYAQAFPVIFITPNIDVLQTIKDGVSPHILIHFNIINVYSEQGLMGRLRTVPVIIYHRGDYHAVFQKTCAYSKIKFDHVYNCRTLFDVKSVLLNFLVHNLK